MTHDEILTAARERLAEIDRDTARLDTQKAALAEERAKLTAMLGQPQPVAPFVVPWAPPLAPPRPVVLPTPHPYNPEPWWIMTTPPYAGFTLCGVMSSDLVIGGAQRLPSDMRFAS